jgi:hypothetical protein
MIIMNTITFKLNSFLLVIFLFANISQAQKWNFGAHFGMTSAKILWAGTKEYNAWANIKFPLKQFNQSITMGLSGSFTNSEKFYCPFHIDYYNRRFSLGTRGIAQIRNANDEWVTFQADHLNYRLHQLALSGGIGYKIINQLGVEIQPYFHISVTDQEIKIGKVIDWQKDNDFQQDFDFGLSGYIISSFNDFYIKGGYQFGLRKIHEYSIFDIQGGSLGKLSIRNTMFLFLLGYQF